MKHAITPTHLKLVERYKELMVEIGCDLKLNFYAGLEPILPGVMDKSAISVIHYFDLVQRGDDYDGFTEYQILEGARQQITDDNDYIRINVVVLPTQNRIDIDLQVTEIL